jgi:hypothetical protein
MLRLAAEREELRVGPMSMGARPPPPMADAMLLIASGIQAGAPSFGTYRLAGSGDDLARLRAGHHR